jgi:hypothetical protein
MSQISNPFSLAYVVYPNNRSRSEALCDISQQAYFSRQGVVSPKPNPQGGGPPLIGCPLLLIQYIRSYPPYLEVVSSIRNLRTRHAVVIRTLLTVAPDDIVMPIVTHILRCELASPVKTVRLKKYVYLPQTAV